MINKSERAPAASISSGYSWTNSHSIISLEATKCKFSLEIHFNFARVKCIKTAFFTGTKSWVFCWLSCAASTLVPTTTDGSHEATISTMICG